MPIIIMYKVLLLKQPLTMTKGTYLLSDFANACCAIRHIISPQRMLLYIPKIYFSLGVGIQSFVDY